MSKNLKDDILNACRGFERDHILATLKGILDEQTPQTLRDLFNMSACPSCGGTEVYITDVMHGVSEGRPHIVAKMGFCRSCKFHGPKVYKRDLKNSATDAMWTKKTVQAWNASHFVNIFTIAEELFGEEYQYSLNAEETFELIESLTRYGKLTSRDRRYDRRQESDAIVSEMADVIICIFQLLHTRRISPEVLNSVMKNKLDSLCTHESVRTAIAELSNNVKKASLVNVHIVDADSVKPS